MGSLGRGIRGRNACRDPAAAGTSRQPRMQRPRQEAIRQRVTAILPLYRLSRYRPIARPRQAPIQPTPNEHNQAPDTPTSGPATSRRQTAADAAAAPAPGERAQERLTEPPAEDPDDEPRSHPTASLPDVAWISARDGSRAIGDLEDQAARYHPGRHELTINADFRAIGDHRPLAGPLPRNRRRPDGDRGTGARMVRTDPRRGSTRRVQLALDRGPTRRVAIAHLVHRHPVAQTPAARDTPDAARAEARTTAQRCGRTGAGRKRHGAGSGQVAAVRVMRMPGSSRYGGKRGEPPRSWLGTDMDVRAISVDPPGDVIIRGRVTRSLGPL